MSYNDHVLNKIDESIREALSWLDELDGIANDSREATDEIRDNIGYAYALLHDARSSVRCCKF